MESKLRNRLMFLLYHKLGDDKQLMVYHRQLQDIAEDHLSLASVHYLRGHYEEAIEIYKRLLMDNR
jgi:intraflagellar transport protein 56